METIPISSPSSVLIDSIPPSLLRADIRQTGPTKKFTTAQGRLTATGSSDVSTKPKQSKSRNGWSCLPVSGSLKERLTLYLRMSHVQKKAFEMRRNQADMRAVSKEESTMRRLSKEL